MNFLKLKVLVEWTSNEGRGIYNVLLIIYSYVFLEINESLIGLQRNESE